LEHAVAADARANRIQAPMLDAIPERVVHGAAGAPRKNPIVLRIVHIRQPVGRAGWTPRQD